MTRNVSNAIWGTLDYISFPAGMLLIAPLVLHHIGVAEYGLWMVCTSMISAGGIISSGFCDAGIQQVASLRSRDATSSIQRTIHSLFAINFILGTVLATLLWLVAPYAAHRLLLGHGLTLAECVGSLHVAALAVLVRAVEAVPVCVQRAFEEYSGTVQISVATRLLTLGAAALLALTGGRTLSILLVTTAVLAVGTLFQLHSASRFFALRTFTPLFHMPELRALVSSGVFVWLQTLSGVLFRQLDRIVLGLFLGAAAVVPYSFSVQLSEPLFSLTASCLSFFFPYLSGRAGELSSQELARIIRKGFLCNLLLVGAGAAVLLLIGRPLLRLWAGAAVESSAHTILPLIIIGSALSGLGVIATYAGQALGMFRAVAFISITSRAAMLLLMLVLLNRDGLHGLAISRVCYGAAALLLYLPLIRRLLPRTDQQPVSVALAAITEIQAGGQS
jgi:O-antigen/teichoic acid export membrane protein